MCEPPTYHRTDCPAWPGIHCHLPSIICGQQKLSKESTSQNQFPHSLKLLSRGLPTVQTHPRILALASESPSLPGSETIWTCAWHSAWCALSAVVRNVPIDSHLCSLRSLTLRLDPSRWDFWHQHSPKNFSWENISDIQRAKNFGKLKLICFELYTCIVFLCVKSCHWMYLFNTIESSQPCIGHSCLSPSLKFENWATSQVVPSWWELDIWQRQWGWSRPQV